MSFQGTARFQVIRRLGAGGMGVVYEVYDRERRERVALKTLRGLDAQKLIGLKSEFRALQDLQHPNLVWLGELLSEDGNWFFTMELIEGSDFFAWVRPNGVLDEGRLRGVLAQLASALEAIHEAGLVHRDVKPSNLLVAPDGRLKLVDFGLAAGTGTAATIDAISSPRQVVGTANYMAPEQALTPRVGPEADWYAVGVLLYQAVTGILPFSGAPVAVLKEKQRYQPAPPSTAADVPADLDTLCADLLSLDPGARPRGSEVLRRLGGRSAPAQGAFPGVFVGRGAELGALRAALARVRGGATAVVCVSGESGLGKTALVRRFSELVGLEEAGAVILVGRCYERESMPYKAFDGVIDALCRWLCGEPEATATALAPRHASLLLQVFPVLARVAAFKRVPRAGREPGDAIELRTRLFGAVRELVGRMAQDRLLVVTIDDLHWADADSRVLLRELLAPPDPPAFLLLVTSRDEEVLPGARQLRLPPLTQAESRHLAERLLGVNRTPGTARAVIDEARGHPLFISELARHPDAGAKPVQFEEAIAARLAHLDATSRRVVEVVAVAGAPLAQEVVARAAGLEFSAFSAAVSALRAEHLVRTGGTRRADPIEAYHDRVGEAVTATLEAAVVRGHHEHLAVALEALGGDAEAQAVHWHAAGRLDRAAAHAATAADQAAAALAFDRAARFYELAAAGPSLDPTVSLKLAEALANCGEGARAADAYLAAARAGAGDAADLRHRAALHLLLAGHVDRGLVELEAVLDEVGMRLPRTPRAALVPLLWRKAILALRGLGFRERAADSLSPNELRRVDVAWSVTIGLAFVDTFRSAETQSRHLLLALKAGEPYRVARAVTLEAVHAAAAGDRRRAARLFDLGETLAERCGHPHARALAVAGSALAAYLEGRFAAAQALAQRAEELLRGLTGVVWELDTYMIFYCSILMHLGELGELVDRHATFLEQARRRGDLYLDCNLRTGQPNLAWLAQDDPETARREAVGAIRRWSRLGFFLEHFYDLLAQGRIDLYEGNTLGAYRRVEERWPAYRGSLLLRVTATRVNATYLRGCAAVQASRIVTRAEERQRLLDQAAGCARALSRERVAWAEALGALLRGGLLEGRGRGAEASTAWAEAASRCDHANLTLHAAAARWLRGALVGGEQGRALQAEAAAWATRQRVRQLPALVRAISPGPVG